MTSQHSALPLDQGTIGQIIIINIIIISIIIILSGRVALGAQQPIVIKLSRGRSVGLSVRPCVGLSSALWKNGGSDPDVWHHRSDGSKDETAW